MKSILTKIAAAADLADKVGNVKLATYLDKEIERLTVIAEATATNEAATAKQALSKDDRVKRMHMGINGMLKGDALAYQSRYNTLAGLPSQMKIALERDLSNSEIVDFMKIFGFEYKTWGEMWKALAKFNMKFTEALKSKYPFVVDESFLSVPHQNIWNKIPGGDVANVEIDPRVGPGKPAEIKPVRPEPGQFQSIPLTSNQVKGLSVDDIYNKDVPNNEVKRVTLDDPKLQEIPNFKLTDDDIFNR